MARTKNFSTGPPPLEHAGPKRYESKFIASALRCPRQWKVSDVSETSWPKPRFRCWNYLETTWVKSTEVSRFDSKKNCVHPDIPAFKMPNVYPTWRCSVRSVVCPYTQHVLSYSLHITYPTYCPKNLNKGIIIISLYPTFCMVAPGFLNAHWSYGGGITYCKAMQWIEIDCDMVNWYHSLGFLKEWLRSFLPMSICK